MKMNVMMLKSFFVVLIMLLFSVSPCSACSAGDAGKAKEEDGSGLGDNGNVEEQEEVEQNEEEEEEEEEEEFNEGRRDGSISDLVLIYGGGAHRDAVWNQNHFAPYVTYVDRENKEHWLFDGFLLLEFVNNSKIFATGYYNTPANQSDWQWLADYFFTPNLSIDAIDKQIAEKIKTLDEPPTKRKIVIALPEPIVAGPNSNYTGLPADYWGSVAGRRLNFTVQNDRIAACKWFIDYVVAKFNERAFDNVELAGFYWIAEESRHTQTILASVGEYLEEKDYFFYWIPYWKNTNPDYFKWKDLGFHYAYLQPNHFFNQSIPYSRLEEACRIAKQYDLDLELEFDMRVFVDRGDWGDRLYDYMRAFRESGIMENKRIAYYQDTDALYHLSRATGAKERQIYHDFCQFVLEHQYKYNKE